MNLKFALIFFVVAAQVIEGDAGIFSWIVGKILGAPAKIIAKQKMEKAFAHLDNILTDFGGQAKQMLGQMDGLYGKMLGQNNDNYDNMMSELSYVSDKIGSLHDQQMTQNVENQVNLMLQLNDIDGKFDILTSQITDIDGKIVNITFMLEGMDEKLDTILDLAGNINGKMDLFSNQLEDLSSQINDQTLKLKVEIKFQSFFALISQIDRYYNQLEVIATAYSTNPSELVYHLDQLIDNYRKENLEYEIVTYIDLEFVGTDSLINSFIAMIASIQPNHKSPIASTTSKMIYDFYMSILSAVSDGNAYLRTILLMRAQISGGSYVEDLVFAEIRENSHLQILMESLESSLARVEALEHTMSFHNLQRVGQLSNTNTASLIYIGENLASPGFVVTGVRFNVERNITFLQIQVGQLGPMATVVQSTVHWQPLPEDIAELVEPFDAKTNSFGMDKYWYKEQFVTGVQMFKSGDALRLRLFAKDVDVQSFALGVMKAKQKSLSKYTYADQKVSLDTKTSGVASGSQIVYDDFKITKDVALTFSQKEVGQTALPFFDTNEVSFDIKAPIAGIGFYHYTNNDDYAGFIKPYLVTLDYNTIFNIPVETSLVE